MLTKIALGALVLMNVWTFVLFGVDKRRAIHGMWRIPERTLLIYCALFGAAGGLAGMRAFRHKTRHAKFVYGVPALLAVQIALAAWGLLSYF